MGALALSYLAGLLTTLNPCVVPMLPLVLAGTLGTNRHGPLLFAAGMTASFTAAGLFVASVGIALGITPQVIAKASAALFVLLGAAMLIAPLRERFALAAAGVATGANGLMARAEGLGGWSPLLIGALAGALWSPCSGPSLGVAVTLAAEAGGLPAAALRMVVFGLGASTVLVLLAYGSRAAIRSRRDALLAWAERVRPVAGVLLIAVGVLALAGWDKQIEIALLDRMPDWLNDLTVRY